MATTMATIKTIFWFWLLFAAAAEVAVEATEDNGIVDVMATALIDAVELVFFNADTVLLALTVVEGRETEGT